jgi:hypothetical protein
MFGTHNFGGPTADVEHSNVDAHDESWLALVTLSLELTRAWAVGSTKHKMRAYG